MAWRFTKVSAIILSNLTHWLISTQVDSMLVALGIPGGAEWALNEDDDNFESLYAMHFLTAVVSGIGCLLFFRLYSDAIKPLAVYV